MVYFQTKIPILGKILDDLEMESVGIFYGPLVCFTAIWYILWSFGIFWVRLVFFRFGTLYKEKSGNNDQDLSKI
jgi:hypothetical protein